MGDKIKGTFFVAIGILLLVASSVEAFFSANGVKQQTAIASGKVYRVDYPIEFVQPKRSYHINIDFATADGAHVKVYKSCLTPYAEGDVLRMRYNPAQPDSECTIDSPLDTYMFSWITGSIGFVHLLLGLYLRRQASK